MKRLFIVEDEAIIAMDLAEQLEEFDYDVVGIAHDSEAALLQLKDLDPDLILMDIVLGNGPDGIETAEQILQSRSIPIIFLTAFSDPTTVCRAAKTAPYGYITKPYNSQALRASIEIALAKHQLEHRLLYKERWFSNILHAVHDGIIAVGIDGKVHFANDEACRILEIENPDEIIDQDVSDLKVYDAMGERIIDSPVASAMQRNAVMPITFGGSLKNSKTGNRIFIDYTAAPVRGQSNAVIGGLLAFRNASQRLNIESAIRNSDGRFEVAFSKSSVGIALVAFNNQLIEANPAFCHLFDCDKDNNLNVMDDLLYAHNDKLKILDGQMMLLAGQQTNIQHEIVLSDKATSTHRNLLINITLLHDNQGVPSYYFYQVYDLTDRKNAEQKLYHLANYDVMTGLINQSQLRNEIQHCLEVCQYENSKLAVITLDIDNFKAVNDQYGLSAGDKVLSELALRFKDMAYFNQIIGRPGGDRFCIILHSLESINQAMFVASRALEELSEPFFIDAHEICFTACAGISVAPDDGLGHEALINASNEALQVAKSNGVGQVSFYNADFSAKVKGRIRNEVSMIQALEEGLFELKYARLHRMTSDKPADIIRILNYWPQRDCFLEPIDFIDIADHSGLAKSMMLHIIERVCSTLADLETGHQPQQVILPFYPAMRHCADVLPAIEQIVKASGLKPECFVFELCGQAARQNRSTNSHAQEFHQMGFSLLVHLPQGQPLAADMLCQIQPAFYTIQAHETEKLQIDCLRATLAMTHSLGIVSILNASDDTPNEPGLGFDLRFPSRKNIQDLSSMASV